MWTGRNNPKTLCLIPDTQTPCFDAEILKITEGTRFGISVFRLYIPAMLLPHCKDYCVKTAEKTDS